jgi:hypothetical protein
MRFLPKQISRPETRPIALILQLESTFPTITASAFWNGCLATGEQSALKRYYSSSEAMAFRQEG